MYGLVQHPRRYWRCPRANVTAPAGGLGRVGKERLFRILQKRPHRAGDRPAPFDFELAVEDRPGEDPCRGPHRQEFVDGKGPFHGTAYVGPFDIGATPEDAALRQP